MHDVLLSRSVLHPAADFPTVHEEETLVHVWDTLLLIQERPLLAPLLDSRAPQVDPGGDLLHKLSAQDSYCQYGNTDWWSY